MKKRYIFLAILIIALLIGAITVVNSYNYTRTAARLKPGSVTTTSVKFVKSTITASGTVTAQSQATLNFQTSGKLVYLPFKEGDTVKAGQTIARLDTYQLQRQLSAALNNYRSTRDTFDQTQDNANSGVLQGQQKYNLQVTNKGGFEVSDVMGNIIKRILDQNQSTLDNSVINVELASYALQLATLTSPLAGIITHQGVAVSGINITPSTAFTVADPDSIVFRVNVPAVNIYYIAEDGPVTLVLDGIPDKITGTIVKIYPSKITLASGQSVYQVDIASDMLKTLARMDQAGTAIISTNAQNVALVPAWTVLNGKYIWIENNGIPEFRQVTPGKIHGSEIEIHKGLNPDDKIIVDPKYISSQKYQLL